MELLLVIAVLAVVAVFATSRLTGLEERAKITSAKATLNALREALCGAEDFPGIIQDLRHEPGVVLTDIRLSHALTADFAAITETFPDCGTFDPDTNSGWRGPYARAADVVDSESPLYTGGFPAPLDRRSGGDATFMQRGFHKSETEHLYEAPGAPAASDPWGNPIVLQIPPESAFDSTPSPKERLRHARLVSAGPNGRLDVAPADLTAEAHGDDLVAWLVAAPEH